jgi:glycerophosphoryl diester phosphodiesterase
MDIQSNALLVIAHRGARAFAPENTLDAFRKAAQLGADMIELDVQLTADNQLIVVHDDSLERCSNVRELFATRADYRVQSFTLGEIRQLDAGSWLERELKAGPEARQPFLRSLEDDELRQYSLRAELASYSDGHVRHPTLVESLAVCRDLGVRVNVELKPTHGSSKDAQVPASVTDQAVHQIAEFGMHDRVLISSFDHASLQRVKELDSAVPTGVLVSLPIAEPVAYCKALHATAYHPGCCAGSDAVGFDTDEFRSTGRLPVEPIRSLRAAGIAVHVWTENDPDRMRLLIDAGVSGIFTDYPNRLRAIVGR